MQNYNSNSKRTSTKSSKLTNSISRHSSTNNFLLDNLISDLYSYLINLVPARIAHSASINSRDTFEYFLDYNIEKIQLIIKKNNNYWNLSYRVDPSYLDTNLDIENNYNISSKDIVVINLKDFYESKVKRYYN